MKQFACIIVVAALLCGCGSDAGKWQFEAVSFSDSPDIKVVFPLPDGDKIESAGSVEGALNIIYSHGWELVAVSQEKGRALYQIKHRDPVGQDKFKVR